MRLLREAAAILLGAGAAGLADGLVHGAADGFELAGLLAAAGMVVLAATRVLVRMRHRLGSLAWQFRVGVALAVVLVLAAVGLIAMAMFKAHYDLFIVALLLAFAAGLVAYASSLLTREVRRDIDAVQATVAAVADGGRDARVDVRTRDELAALAAAINGMIERLAASERDRDAADRARRRLFAEVSHDLRTPLTSLRLLAAAVDEGVVTDAPTRRRYLGELSLHVQSLESLIEDLFDLARLEAGVVGWSFEALPLDELLRETVDAMRAWAGAEHVVIDIAIPTDLPAARANPEKLQRVLFNLLDNAVRHTPAEGRVTVRAGATPFEVEIEVADTGTGIRADERERVVEPFTQGEDDNRPRGGAGLGLAICRAIVEAHGGYISFPESTDGARVRFSLPRAP